MMQLGARTATVDHACQTGSSMKKEFQKLSGSQARRTQREAARGEGGLRRRSGEQVLETAQDGCLGPDIQKEK